jgi:hypothetical protein
MKKFNDLYKRINENYENEEVFERYLEKINFRYEDAYQLQNIIEILGYRQGFQEFFADNPGASEKVLEFIPCKECSHVINNDTGTIHCRCDILAYFE